MNNHTILETLLISTAVAVISRLIVAALEWGFVRFYIRGDKELLAIWHKFRNHHHVNAAWCRRRGCYEEIKKF